MLPEFFTPILLVLPAGQALSGDGGIPADQFLTSWLAAQTKLPSWPPDIRRSIQHLNPSGEPLTMEELRAWLPQLGLQVPVHQLQIFVLHQLHQSAPAVQHALLKTLEEPPPRTLIVVTTSDPEAILPTINSRCLLVKFDQVLEKGVVPGQVLTPELQPVFDLIKQLLQAPTTQLAAWLPLTEQIPDRASAEQILDAAINWLHQQIPPSPAQTARLQALLSCRQSLRRNGNLKLHLDLAWTKLVS